MFPSRFLLWKMGRSGWEDILEAAWFPPVIAVRALAWFEW